MSGDSTSEKKNKGKVSALKPKDPGKSNGENKKNGVLKNKDQKPNGKSGETEERKRAKPDEEFERKLPHGNDPNEAQGYVEDDVIKKENSDLNKEREKRSGRSKKALDD